MEWPRVPIERVADVNPKDGRWQELADHDLVAFVPMQAVSEASGSITRREVRSYAEVKRGYTPFQENDVLFAKITPCMENGKIAIARELEGGVGFGSTEFHVLRAVPSLLPEYLYYFLRQPAFRSAAKQQMRGGVGQQRVPEDSLRKEIIPVPPLSEQRRIVEILDQADRLRRLRAEAGAKADRTLPALFIKMFGDPATNPMGWPVRPLGDRLLPVLRRDPIETPDESFVYIDIGGVDGASGVISETTILQGAEAPSRARQIVEVGDILVSTVRPYLRATAMVPAELDEQICSTGFCVLRPRVKALRGYLYALTRTQWFTDQLMSRARGASYPAVTDRDILQLPVPSPGDVALLVLFDKFVEALASQRERRRNAMTAIANLFTSLLARAFSGSLTGSWREAHMKELLQEMEQQANMLAESLP